MPYQGQHAETGREWKVGMCGAPCESPGKFMFYCVCPCLGVVNHREVLIGNGPYYCCNRHFPVCCLKDECPRSCVWCEACCCLNIAIGVNRHILQDRYAIRNTPCDECILWCTCLTSWCLCIMRCCGYDVPPEVQNCVDCLYCTVQGCMQTQQAIEMEAVGCTLAPPPANMKMPRM